MSNYPDDFNARLCDAANIGPAYVYPDPDEISKFIKSLSVKLTLQIAAEFEEFYHGSSYELDANLSECLDETIDEAAYNFFKLSQWEREDG